MPLNRHEGEMVVMLHRIHGSRWARIAKGLPGRAPYMVKAWYLEKLEENARIRWKMSIQRLIMHKYDM